MPAGWTFAALLAGLAIGWVLSGSLVADKVGAIASPIGTIWLRGLQMTIVPLVAALLVTGIVRMVATAQAGAMARRTLLTILAILASGTVLAAFAMPALLEAFPIPGREAAALARTSGEAQEVPGIGEFFESLISSNVIAAAAETAMLPLIVFFALFGAAVARLPDDRRDLMVRFFEALGETMLLIIGWVLWIAPVGVFALALGVGLDSGGGAFTALGHYILVVSALGFAVMLAAYALGVVGGGYDLLVFARAVLPSQAVAISTQSSLASLPAMLAACRALGLRQASADFVLPLAVALFRATSPAMNVAVVIYVAWLTGTPLTATTLAAGVGVAFATTWGTISLPGTISFIASTGPIALAMGVPLEPLALLVAVEMLPDIMRTLGNVTMDVAVTATVDRRGR